MEKDRPPHESFPVIIDDEKPSQKQQAQAPLPNERIPTVQQTMLQTSQDQETSYKQKMSDYLKPAQQRIKSFQLLKANVPRSRMGSQCRFKIKFESINKEVVVLTVKWGNVSIDLSILNIMGANIQHGVQIGQGGFGSIYHGSFNTKEFVIKCIHTQSAKDRIRAIKECFLTRLCSELKICPKMEKIFGFDLLIFQECVQFAIEYCQQPKKETFAAHELYQNLAILHQLHLVHQDIKPQNIMYSPSFKRLVFIDFGLSAFISEDTGFKTFTSFIGSINNCSPEMRQAYINKKKMHIDLYYNDLYCLEGSISNFSDFFSMFSLKEVPDQQQFFNNEEKRLEPFSYLLQVLLKYYLFENKFEDAIFFLQNQVLKSTHKKKDYVTEILYFMEELAPNLHLQLFFKSVVTERHKDLDVYIKIKTLYEVCQNNLCQLQIFRREQKIKYFDTIYQQMFRAEDIEEVKPTKKDIKKMLMNTDSKQGISLEQINLYLESISFTNNQFSVSTGERMQFAELYYKKYIKKQLLIGISYRKLIETTILHALEVCLKRQNMEQKDLLSNIFFRIVDFLAILDMGSSSQFINWLERILSHKVMEPRLQYWILARVGLSNSLNKFRIKPKTDMIRIDFFQKICQFKQEENAKLLKICDVKYLTSFEGVSSELVEQFGREAMQWKNMHTKNIQECNNYINQIIALFYKLKSHQKSKKLYLFLPVLLERTYFKMNNNNLCRLIYSIIANNFMDRQLENQFNFELIVNMAFKLVGPVSIESVFVQDLVIVNNYLHKIEAQQGMLVYELMRILSNKAIFLQNIQKYNIDYLYESSGFITKTFNILKLVVIRSSRHFNPHSQQCISIILLQNLLLFSKIFPKSKQKEVLELVQSIKCQKCSQVLSIISLSSSMQNYLLRYSHYGPHETVSKQEIQVLFFKVYQQFIASFQSFNIKTNSQFFQLYEKGLRMGQIFCWQSYELQAQHHAIRNYYDLLIANDSIRGYFKSYQMHPGIVKILQLLDKTDWNAFVDLLFKMAKQIQRSLLVSDYSMVAMGLDIVFKTYDHERILSLVKRIKIFQTQNTQTSPYIALIYGIILSFAKKEHLFKIIKLIRRHFDNITYTLRRSLVIRMYRALHQEKDSIKRRQWLYCNNRLIKCLIVDQRTVAVERSFKETNPLMTGVIKRVKKYEQYKRTKPYLRFRIK